MGYYTEKEEKSACCKIVQSKLEIRHEHEFTLVHN